MSEPYHRRPEVKVWRAIMRQLESPEHRAARLSREAAWRRAYNQRPEVKARIAAYSRARRDKVRTNLLHFRATMSETVKAAYRERGKAWNKTPRGRATRAAWLARPEHRYRRKLQRLGLHDLLSPTGAS